MKKNIYALLLIICALFIISCSSDDDSSTAAPSQYVINLKSFKGYTTCKAPDGTWKRNVRYNLEFINNTPREVNSAVIYFEYLGGIKDSVVITPSANFFIPPNSTKEGDVTGQCLFKNSLIGTERIENVYVRVY